MMRKYLNFVLFLVVLGTTSCVEEAYDDNIFMVEVLGVGMDCGDTWLIKFNEGDEREVNRYLENTNAYFPVFYADDLPEDKKETGLFLNITLGECSENDISACTAMGPGYAHVCIKSAETISIASE